MTYGSVCSGIEAATVAWHPLKWKAAWFAEIDKFPSAVLAHHYPNVPNYGDFTKITAERSGPINLLVGGTPCQDFSIGGLKAGFDGERGKLTIEFFRILARLKARWFLWENVPNVLSIDNGRGFSWLISEVAKLGYGISYRVLNARHFGVAQNRRRVFVVGFLGDWRNSAKVLFEREGLQGMHTKERAKIVSRCLTARGSGSLDDRETYIAEDHSSIRHMTPLEAERLQGFPDNYTLIPFGNGVASDAARNKAVANSFPVPVVRWIGSRIQAVEESTGIEQLAA